MSAAAELPLPTWPDVQDFWFGGPVDQLFHHRWFPAACGGAAAQAAADAEVERRFGRLLDAAAAGETERWPQLCPSAAACQIVVLDQFSRHIYRHRGAPAGCQAAVDALALRACTELLASGRAERLSVPEHVFSLFPLRHSATLERLTSALACVEARARAEETHAALLHRFRRATLRRLQELQGKTWTEGEEVLERPFALGGGHAEGEAAEALLRPPLAQAVAAFFRARRAPAEEGAGEARVEALVSLSGGVDSMVLCAILAAAGRAARPPFLVGAAHIDYGNRPESGAEADFVQAWCREQRVPCRLLAITGLRRGISEREEYERESRRLRYDMYRECLAAWRGARGVCVGHHSGDVAENVLTNLCKGNCLLGISGMAEEAVVNGVPVWRPMLAFDKDAIFQFAHQHNIPYFKDSTPGWSTRGKLRRNLLPALEEVFGSGILRTLARLGADADAAAAMLQSSLLGPFAAAASVSDAGAIFDARLWLAQPPLFWREALRQLYHRMGSGLVGEKAVLELLRRLQRNAAGARRGAEGWIALKRENRSYLAGTRVVRPPRLFSQPLSIAAQGIFAADFFPAEPHYQPSAPLRLGRPAAFGPWTVLCEAVEEPLVGPELLSLWDALGGVISYRLPLTAADAAGAEPGEGWLGLRTARAPRLPSLRGLPRRLRVALPLVVTGEDRDGTEGLDESESEEEEGRRRGERWAAQPTFRVRAWSEAELGATRCVRVTLSYARARTNVAL